jgi:hypothetical protein
MTEPCVTHTLGSMKELLRLAKGCRIGMPLVMDHRRGYIWLEFEIQVYYDGTYPIVHGVLPTFVLFGYPNRHQLTAYLRLSIFSSAKSLQNYG